MSSEKKPGDEGLDTDALLVAERERAQLKSGSNQSPSTEGQSGA